MVLKLTQNIPNIFNFIYHIPCGSLQCSCKLTCNCTYFMFSSGYMVMGDGIIFIFLLQIIRSNFLIMRMFFLRYFLRYNWNMIVFLPVFLKPMTKCLRTKNWNLAELHILQTMNYLRFTLTFWILLFLICYKLLNTSRINFYVAKLYLLPIVLWC